MIVLLGATGYVGQAFDRELTARGESVVRLSRKKLDYTRYETLLEFLKETRPRFLINAAGYTGRPNVDACEIAKADTLKGNSLFPLTVSHACQTANVAWGHVSSGCIYAGAKIIGDESAHVETDLTKVGVRDILRDHPQTIVGFDENDTPNFSFRHPPCSFYSGTKALGEESLQGDERVYVWRMRMPFDEQDNPRNYLSKLQRYSKIYENFNSLSHRADFARACLDLFRCEAPFGTYNVTNPGYVSTREVAEFIQTYLAPDRTFDYWANDEEFYKTAAKAPRSNCILDVSKLLSTGVSMRPVREALRDSVVNWRWEQKIVEPSDFPKIIQQGVS
jgi:UDP-glucose 4,6-dehydratase